MSFPENAPETRADSDVALRQLAFLADAGEVLSSSLDYEETLRQVALLVVRELGDLCVLDVVEDGVLQRVATAHVLPDKARLVEDLARRFPAHEGSPSPAARVFASGATELLEDVTAEVVASHTRDGAHAALIRAIGMRSHIAVPMRARAAVVGVLSVGITESDRRYGAGDVQVVEELGRRAALAVDNARLYRASQREVERRRQAEAELRLSEARHRAILEQSPLSTQVLAPDGRTLVVNRAWEALWDLRLEQLAGYNILEDPQLEASGIAPLLRRAFAGEAVTLPVIAYDIRGRDPGAVDPIRWVTAFAYPVRDLEGRVREVVLVHQDVSEARRAEERLRASESRLNRAVSAGSMVVWEWDLDTDAVACSGNAEAFWGRAVGRASDFFEAAHPDDVHLLREAAAAAVERGAPFRAEHRLRRVDGGVHWAQSRAQVERAADGRALRILGVTIENTERKLAEDGTRVLADAGKILGASLDYEATLAALTRAVVPGFADWCAVDLLADDGELQRVSVSHRDPARVALARRLFEEYPPSRAARRGAWRAIESGEAVRVERLDDDALARMATGDAHLAILRALHLRSYLCVPLTTRGTTLGALTLAHAESGRHYRAADVELALEIGRRAASAVDNARLVDRLQLEDRRKDEFLATLAHELRNPLAPIRTGLALLRTNPDPALAARTRQTMERQLGHMVRLIDDLLDLSRVTRDTLELRVAPTDLALVVESAVEACRPAMEAGGLRFTVALPPRAVTVDADHTRLAQVVTNLLNNAARFTPRGGDVALTVREDEGSVLVEVRDTGVGIPPEAIGRIFDMFERAAGSHFQGGLGIGLTLARRLAELHGGALVAESAGLGRGSRFVLTLPRSRSAPASAPTSAPIEAPAGGPARRVLVVDDNQDAAEMLQAVLEQQGHVVRTAGDGEAALTVARGFGPEVAFLDIGLPGMSGHELAAAFRADPALAGTTLIALTGWGRAEDRARARAAGFDHHLTKPVDVNAVLELAARARG